MHNKESKAFTLIELIIVIVLLGVLSATALPRFVDFSADAHQAKHEGLVGTLQAAVRLAHSKWRTSGQAGSADIGGTTVYFNSNGYPESTSGAANGLVSTDECIEIWLALVPDYPNPAMRSFSLDVCGADPAQCPMYALYANDTSNNATYCRYRMLGSGTMYNKASPWYNDIIYNTSTGTVECLRSLQTVGTVPTGFTNCHWNDPLIVP